MATIQISFKDNRSRAHARWLVLTNKEGIDQTVGNRPTRDLIVDVKALQLLQRNGIKMYPPTTKSCKPSYEKELDISKL